jgi:hypothetical protein
MDELDLQTASALIDFSGKGAIPAGMAEQQLTGTVALHNMLAKHGLAYLADEVGMGCTCSRRTMCETNGRRTTAASSTKTTSSTTVS